MSVPTVTLNEATPAGSDKIREGDDRIREFKTQVREIVDIDHKYDSSGQDGDMGKHNKCSFIEAADIGSGAEGKPILGAQTVSGKAELVFTDEDDNDVKLTSGGESIATETPDSSAPTADEDIANKKYVDDKTWDAATDLTGVTPDDNGGTGVTHIERGTSSSTDGTNKTVTFGTSFADTSYTVIATVSKNTTDVASIKIISKAAGNFVWKINGSSSTVGIEYIAIGNK